MAERPVWMIIAHFYPAVGGAERQAQRVSRHLIADHGVDVKVLTRRHSPRLPDELPAHETIDGIPVIRLMSYAPLVSKLQSLSFFLSCLLYLFRHGRGDNYHAHDEGASAWVAIAARYLFGGQSIIKLRVGRKNYEQRRGIRKFLFYSLLRLTSRIVIVSKDVTGLLTEANISADKIVYIPNGIDTDYFHPGDPQSNLRQSLNLPCDKALALFVGRLHVDKGADILLQAWGQLPETVRNQMHLVIVGDGPQTDQLRDMAAMLNIEASISMVGMKQEVCDYYRAVDFLVQPARADGLSNTMLEAMACGLPVVIADTAGALDFIREGENGVFFNYGDANSLTRSLELMLEQKSDWSKMSDCARQTMVVQADVKHTADRMRQIYL